MTKQDILNFCRENCINLKFLHSYVSEEEMVSLISNSFEYGFLIGALWMRQQG